MDNLKNSNEYVNRTRGVTWCRFPEVLGRAPVTLLLAIPLGGMEEYPMYYYLAPVIALLAALVSVNKNTWNKEAGGWQTRITPTGWLVVLIAFTGCVISELAIYNTRQDAKQYYTELRNALAKLDVGISRQLNQKRLDHLAIDIPYALFAKDGRVVVSLENGGALLELSTSSGSMCNLAHSITQLGMTIYAGLCTPGYRFIYHDVVIDKNQSSINSKKLHLELDIPKPFMIVPNESGFKVVGPTIHVSELSKYGNIISSKVISQCPNWIVLNRSEHEKYILCDYDVEVDKDHDPEVNVLSLNYKRNG